MVWDRESAIGGTSKLTIEAASFAGTIGVRIKLALMAAAATHHGHDPDRVSFVAALRITRQTIAQPGALPP